MPWILIKNNLKLMLRSKWILFLMIVLPLITIALLSNAFQEMMETSYTIEKFNIGYRIENNSTYKSMIKEVENACNEQGILLQEYPEGDIKKLLQSQTVAVFVEIKENNSYTIYQSNQKSTEAAITDSIFNSFFYQVNVALTTQTYAAQNGLTPSVIGTNANLNHEKLPTNPVPSSNDYYGIIYIVYFAWCGMVSLMAVVSSERKSAIPKKIRVAHISMFHHYLAKFIPSSLAIFIEVSAAWILSILLFDIHWGNPFLSALIIALISMAASAFGIVLFQLFYNVAISIVIGFIITWIEGFFGGAFQSYMYLNLPDYLIKSSPIYSINRTLVEYSTMGHSSYTGICFGYLIAIILVCSLAGVLLMNRKVEEQ